MEMPDITVKFDSDGRGNCPICGVKKRDIHFQHIKHCQSSLEVEVCTDCKSDFIRINDIFFRGVDLG